MLSKLDIFTKVCWYFYVINFYFFYVQPCTTILFVTILNQSRDTTIMIMSALYMYMAIVAFVYLSFLYLDWRVNPQWTTSQTKSSELFSTYFLYIHTHTHTSRTIQFCFFFMPQKKTLTSCKKIDHKTETWISSPKPFCATNFILKK